MVWMPSSSIGHKGSDASEVPWMGRTRLSMATNCLIARDELGKPRKTTFANPNPTHVFGMKLPSDAEGAKQVTMQWREHTPNPHAKPGPDFKAMNKLAVDSGLTSSKGLREFRSGHTVSTKCGQAALHKAPLLPSEKDPTFVYGIIIIIIMYGKPASYRSAEDCRNCGPSEPPVKGLVQGAYMHSWVDMNAGRADELDAHHGYIKPSPTKATEGHRRGALQATLAKEAAPSSWKMKKFLATGPKVTAYMGGRGQGGAHAQAADASYPEAAEESGSWAGSQ